MKRALLALLLLASPAFGQAPPTPDPAAKAVATARASYPSGSVVFVNATGSKTTWPLQFAVVGRPTEPKMTTDGATGVIFPDLPDGQYFIAVTASAPVVNLPPAIDTAVVSVLVGAIPTPVNPPIPGPAGPPAPPIPSADPLGLTAGTRAILKSMTWSNESLLYRQNTLAPIFAGVASGSAGYASGQAMIADLESKYRSAIGPTSWPQWQASLFAPLKAQLATLTTAKKLVTVADLAEAFTEIGAALKEGN